MTSDGERPRLVNRSVSNQISHRVIELAEQEGLADPLGPGQLVDDIDGGVIGDEERVVFPVFAVERNELQYRGRFLLDRQSLLLELRGQLRERRLDAIIDVDRVDVGIGAKLKTYGEVIAPVIAARALHVDHLVDADDLRLERLRDGSFEHCGGGAGIDRGDLDLGRYDIGELRDRNPG